MNEDTKKVTGMPLLWDVLMVVVLTCVFGKLVYSDYRDGIALLGQIACFSVVLIGVVTAWFTIRGFVKK